MFNEKDITNEVVEYIIDYLVSIFKNTIQLVNKYRENVDAYSYYLNGHCPTFSYILYTIFGGKAEIYTTNNHVITKINGNFYDIRGKINDQVDINTILPCTIEDLETVQMYMGNNDDTDKKVANILIKKGQQKLRIITKKQSKTTLKRII